MNNNRLQYKISLDNNNIARRRRLILGVALIYVIAMYLIMHGNIRKESIDDSWVLNWFYNYIYSGQENDIAFMVGSSPIGGITLFAKLQAVVYGNLLKLAGWSLNNAFWISTSFIILAGALWAKIFKAVGIDRYYAYLAALLMLMLEPFLFAGNCARGDSFGFFLASLTLMLFIKEKYILTGVMLMLALETHLMAGATSGIYLLAYVISYSKKFSLDKNKLVFNIAKFILGVVAGTVVYALLHQNGIDLILNGSAFTNIKRFSGGLGDNFILGYFLNERFMRHLPELIILLVSIGICVYKKAYKDCVFSIVLLLLSIILSLITRRESAPYIIFVYPAFMMSIILAVQYMKKELIVILLFACLLTPQYFYVYKIYSSYDINAYATKLNEYVPKNGVTVLGNANSWFAFQGRDWYEYTSVGYGHIDADKIYIIQNKNYIQYTKGRQEQWKDIMRTYPSKIIKSFEVNGEQVNIRVYNKNEL